MDIVGILSGFANKQVFGLAIFLLGLGFVLSKWAKIDKKKTPWLFVLIAVPISVIYNTTLSVGTPLFVSVMDGIYDATFSCLIAMGVYDLGKPIATAILKRFAKANEVPIEEVEFLKEPDPVPQPPQPIICAYCGQEIKGENHEN